MRPLFVNNSCLFHPALSRINCPMKTKNRSSWSAEENRRYLETWLTGLAGLVTASGKPLGFLAAILFVITGRADNVIQWILRLF